VVGALGVLLVLVASLAGYLLLGRDPANPAETIASAAPANVPAPRPAPTTTPATPTTINPAAAVPAASPASPVTIAAATPAVVPAPPAPRPAPAARKAHPAAPPALAAAASIAAPARNASSAATPTSNAEERVYAVNELPDDIRRQLPALSIGGSMYSPKAADRLVIVNGQVLHEGDRLSPDLLLQQIKVKTAVFVFKNYRVAIAF
jgi:general secretion pathway protein B